MAEVGQAVNKPPQPLYTAARVATWQITLYKEWFIFTPPGDPRESYEEALKSARALKARAGR